MSIPICWTFPWGRILSCGPVFNRLLWTQQINESADWKSARSLKSCLTVLLAIAGSAAYAGDLLSDYQPATIQSPYGPVNRVEFSTGVVKLKPHGLVQSP